MKQLLILLVLVGLGSGAALPQGERATDRATAAGDQEVSSTWKFLSEKYDKNKDGSITKEEYERDDSKFDRYDRNDDGKLTSADFPARRSGGRGGRGGRRGGGGRMGGAQMRESMGKRVFTQFADANKDKNIPVEEWKAFIARIDCDSDGVVDDKAFESDGSNTRMVGFMIRSLDADEDGKLQVKELVAVRVMLDKDKNGTLEEGEFYQAGRMGGRRGRGGRGGRGGGRRGGGGRTESGLPKAGDAAPDFTLPMVDKTDKTVTLSSFSGKKPVALIFGSYT